MYFRLVTKMSYPVIMQSNLYLDGPKPGEVRLYQSSYLLHYYYGRVEVFLSETWGTVTGPWTRANAEVVCHQLGYDISGECMTDLYFIET